ncbi:MAG: DUF59 domain-containing protein [Phycisphaerales bacterium]|nr:DUF59 domain-containing protein [Phycisphaerales bacterium]
MTEPVQQQVDREDLARRIVAVLRNVYDPEIPVNIVDLGLVYALNVDKNGVVEIRMTLTSPGCPVSGVLPGHIEQLVRSIEGVSSARVELVWDPPWGMEQLSPEVRLELGLF